VENDLSFSCNALRRWDPSSDRLKPVRRTKDQVRRADALDAKTLQHQTIYYGFAQDDSITDKAPSSGLQYGRQTVAAPVRQKGSVDGMS
jgi:hypothetical protein